MASWDELLGSNNWAGLVEPTLDDSLREFILRCGDFVVSTYEAFCNDSTHPWAGDCQFNEDQMLAKTFFPFADDYKVTKLLYATADPDSKRGFFLWPNSTSETAREDRALPFWNDYNFVGHVAVSTDEYASKKGRREIVVAWRGTQTANEWWNNFRAAQMPVDMFGSPAIGLTQFLPTRPRVAEAWANIYTGSNRSKGLTSARDLLRPHIKTLVEQYSTPEARLPISIIFTGHSLGGALAVLSAFDIAEQRLAGSRNSTRLCAVTFSSPRIGNPPFWNHIRDKLPKLKILSVKSVGDVVPNVPGIITASGETWAPLFQELRLYAYDTAHKVLKVDLTKSPHLSKKPLNKIWQHDLQNLLHVVAGWTSQSGSFADRNKVEKFRSIALVNRHSDWLEQPRERHIPGNWGQVENKRMVMDKDGKWKLQPKNTTLPHVIAANLRRSLM